MMHGRGKSDEAVVAVKPANKAERSAAELVEPRAEAKGNAGQQCTCRAQNRISVSPALVSIRQAFAVRPEVGAVCGKAARTDLCGGREVTRVPTAKREFMMILAALRLHGRLRCTRSSRRRSRESEHRAPGGALDQVRLCAEARHRFRLLAAPALNPARRDGAGQCSIERDSPELLW